MSRRKITNETVRNVQKSGPGKSYYVTIPVAIMRSLGWRERQKVVVRQYGKDKIIISDWKK